MFGQPSPRLTIDIQLYDPERDFTTFPEVRTGPETIILSCYFKLSSSSFVVQGVSIFSCQLKDINGFFKLLD